MTERAPQSLPCLALSLSRPLSLARSPSLSHFLSHTRSLSLSIYLSLSLSLSPSLYHRPSHTHSLSHTFTHAHTHARSPSPPPSFLFFVASGDLADACPLRPQAPQRVCETCFELVQSSPNGESCSVGAQAREPATTNPPPSERRGCVAAPERHRGEVTSHRRGGAWGKGFGERESGFGEIRRRFWRETVFGERERESGVGERESVVRARARCRYGSGMRRGKWQGG